MTYMDFLKALENADRLITERINTVKQEFDNNNVSYNRIQYEDVYLADILDGVLIPLVIPIIDHYKQLPRKSRNQAYRVYVGTLCEIVKNGLVNGGINKTIEARVGDFNINNHYSLIKTALRFEGIEISSKHRKYEETIINEAGIPRGYHKKCLQLFLIYWKWMHNYDTSERYQFLSKCLNDEPVDRLYIIDAFDKQHFDELVDETSSFSEKVNRTCKKLDSVFAAIDNYTEDITELNIDSVAEEISKELGFNIFTVIRSKSLRKYILEYAKKVSFSKFEHIVSNFPEYEPITLPTNIKKLASDYNPNSYLGGRHIIRGNAYDVSFPIPLEIDDIYKLERNKPLMLGNAVLYTSEEDIWVERDGYERPYRCYYHDQYGPLNAYYERISAASFTYIDGVLINSDQPFKRKVYIGKYWNNDIKHYQLGICIDTIKYANNSYSMRGVELLCDNQIIVQGTTNRSGFFQARDRVIPFAELSTIPDEHFALKLMVNDDVIDSWELDILDLYIWGKNSGNRVREQIDLSEWFGESKVVIFTKRENAESSIEVTYLYDECGYKVYEASFDKTADEIVLFGERICIVKPLHPYIEFLTEHTMVSGELCIKEDDPISVVVHNAPRDNNEIVIMIEHEKDYESYNLNNLAEGALHDLRLLIPNNMNSDSYVGKWSISLYESGIKKSSIQVTVLPELHIEAQKTIYLEGESVSAVIRSSHACFEQEGDFFDEKHIELGKAALVSAGGFVFAEQIEYDCYLDRCEIFKKLSLFPNVWTVQFRSLESGEEINASNNIEFQELEHIGIYICATCNMSILIKANGIGEVRHIKPGLNIIDSKSFLHDAEAKTDFSFTDDNGSRKTISVLYKERIEITNYSEEARVVSFTAKYSGPTNSNIDFRIFSGKNLISINKKKAYRNSFITSLIVEKRQITDKEISIEARVGTQDYKKIYSGLIDLNKQKEEKKTFVLSKDTSIISLLDEYDNNKDVVFCDSILTLLSKGGLS